MTDAASGGLTTTGAVHRTCAKSAEDGHRTGRTCRTAGSLKKGSFHHARRLERAESANLGKRVLFTQEFRPVSERGSLPGPDVDSGSPPVHGRASFSDTLGT